MASLPHHERIEDATFRQAVDLLDAGDADGLRTYLRQHPLVVRQRAIFPDGNYFQNPALLEFVAENPIRHGRLPGNIVAIAMVILDAGPEAASMQATLALVSSGRVARDCGVQVPLIDLLCDHGADPNAAMQPALGHGEFEAVQALIRRGARADLPVAAALGQAQDLPRLLAEAGNEERHRALALAAQFGHAAIVKALLDAGEDPDRYNPVACHSHSTPLHQAALAGHEQVVRLLVERGARIDIRDTLWHGTAADWAAHAENTVVERYLRAREGTTETSAARE